MTRAELESIIEQELISELKEKHKKPSREELLNLVAAVDKESSHKKEQHEEMLSLDEDDSKYYSAGSVNNKLDRKMSPSQIARRKEIGRKIIDAISKPKKERTPAERSLRKALQSSRDTKGPQPNNPYWKKASWEEKINSFAWALASDYVLKKSGTFNIDKRVDKEYRAKSRASKRGAASQAPGGATTTGATQEPAPKEKPTSGPTGAAPSKSPKTGGAKTPTPPSAEKPKKEPTPPSAEKPKKEPTPPSAEKPKKEPTPPSAEKPKKEPTPPSAEKPKKEPTPPSAEKPKKEPTPPSAEKPKKEPDFPKGTPTTARPRISAPSAGKKPSVVSRSSNKYSGLTDPQKKKLTSIIRANKNGEISKKDAIELMNREMEKISGLSRRSNQYTGLDAIDRFRLASITKNLKNKELSPTEKDRLEKIKSSIKKKAKTERGKSALKEYAKYIIRELNNPSLNEQHTTEHVFMTHVLHEIITALGESS